MRAIQKYVGKPVILDGAEYIVIGVMPRSFKTYFDRPMELWLPLLEKAQSASERGLGDLHILGRLKTGMTLQQAQTESAILDHRLAEQFPEPTKICHFAFLTGGLRSPKVRVLHWRYSPAR